MAKKVVIELWVEPLTKSGNYFNFLDNVDEFIEESQRMVCQASAKKAMTWIL